MKSERSLAQPDTTDSEPSAPTRARRDRDTSTALLDAALSFFSQRGFSGASIRDLARAVGIRESSVYKHFTSKDALFDALIARADDHLAEVAASLGTVTSSGDAAATTYIGVAEADLLAIARGMFTFVLHDPEFVQLRRLMTIEQFRDDAVAARYREYFIVRPLAFQTDIFRQLFATGDFRDGLDPEQTALAFFGPIFTLVQLADGTGDEQDALRRLAAHVRHFRRTHLKEE